MLRMIQDCIQVEVPQFEEMVNGVLVVRPKDLKLCEGTVIAVGPGKRNKKGVFVPTTIKTGQTILFGHGKGYQTEYEGKIYLIMREPDVDGITDRIHGNTFDDWNVCSGVIRKCN